MTMRPWIVDTLVQLLAVYETLKDEYCLAVMWLGYRFLGIADWQYNSSIVVPHVHCENKVR